MACSLLAFQLLKRFVRHRKKTLYLTWRKWQRFEAGNFNLDDDDRSDAPRKLDQRYPGLKSRG